MRILHYITPKPLRSRNAAHTCVIRRLCALFICESSQNFSYFLTERTHI